MFCLIPKLADAFKQEIIDGKIDPLKLAEMTSEQRRALFTEKLGGELNAREVNALFESKLLLKNKQLGYINWAKQMLGDKNPALRDIISKIERMDERILSPETDKVFLEDLVNKRLGTEVTLDEAKKIADLSKKMKEAKDKITDTSLDAGTEELEYGANVVALKKYIDELKLSNKEGYKPTDVIKHPIQTAENIGGFAKGMRATGDLSSVGKQLWKLAPDSPGLYFKSVYNSVKFLVKQLGEKSETSRVSDAVMARIYGSKEVRSGLMDRMKVDLGVNEEAFPIPFAEKIPIAGRLFKASEVSYTMAIRLARFELAKKIAKIAENNGGNLRDTKYAQGIGQWVNSMTGRGSLAKFEPAAKPINSILFSAKNFLSNVDFITMFVARKNVPMFLKVRAARNLVIAGASVYMLSKLLNQSQGKEVINTNPTSTNFLRIKVGGMYHDIMGGTTGPIVLLARIFANEKTSGSGKKTEINTGKFGSDTAENLIYQFFGNKLSPLAAALMDIANRTDFDGNPVTPVSVAKSLLVPLTIEDIEKVNKLGSKQDAGIINNMLNFFGFSGYAPYKPKPKQKKF